MKLLARRFCLTCGAQTLTLLFMQGRWRSRRTLAGCLDHRLARHCLFCCGQVTYTLSG
jgi:hypothetical protein